MVGYLDAGYGAGTPSDLWRAGVPWPEVPSRYPRGGTGAAKPVVLVVDDEAPIVDLVADLLAEEGYAVCRAYDGTQALEEAERAQPDLVVTDVMMPRLDGISLARELRRRGYRAPVVLMSAVHAAPDLPGAAFLPKPFDLDHIVAVVERALAGAA